MLFRACAKKRVIIYLELGVLCQRTASPQRMRCYSTRQITSLSIPKISYLKMYGVVGIQIIVHLWRPTAVGIVPRCLPPSCYSQQRQMISRRKLHSCCAIVEKKLDMHDPATNHPKYWLAFLLLCSYPIY